MHQQEIERKFLVSGDGWKGRGKGVVFRQGYIARMNNRTVRVRLAGEKGVLNIKLRSGGIARSEFEYEIPAHEAVELLKALPSEEIIEKTRYTFEQNGNIWEVDEFHGANEGLVIAEIELENEDQEFIRPEWLGDEVSHISKYLNSELSKTPYSSWRGKNC